MRKGGRSDKRKGEGKRQRVTRELDPYGNIQENREEEEGGTLLRSFLN